MLTPLDIYQATTPTKLAAFHNRELSDHVRIILLTERLLCWHLQVYCDHQLNKSYTIIQQRMFGNENFQRGINAYETGFGSASGDYWIGLLTIHHLSSTLGTPTLSLYTCVCVLLLFMGCMLLI